MTRVVHWKKEKFDIYIGRGSKWGNPFMIGRDGTRKEVIEKFEEWILSRPWTIPVIKAELKGKILGCWCKPDKACHGDVLAKIAEEE